MKYAALLIVLLTGCGSPPKVVFAGDSLTVQMQWFWQATMPYDYQRFLDRGVDGNTSGALLQRFQQDVLSTNAPMVHILIGTNDAFDEAQYGSIPLPVTEANIAAMVTASRALGRRVVLGTVPPGVKDWPDAAISGAANANIQSLNAWIRDYSSQNGLTLADYYPVLVQDGFLNPAYSSDGHVHLNEAGYQAIAPVTLDALRFP